MKNRRTNNLLFVILAAVVLSGFFSCSDSDDDEIKDLVISGGTEISAKLNEEYLIAISSGNGGYTVTTDKEDILSPSVKDDYVVIMPKKKGEANISLKDKENKQIIVKVKVVEPYLALLVLNHEIRTEVADKEVESAIKEDIETYSFFNRKYLYKYTVDENNTLEVFEDDPSLPVVASGTYSANKNNFVLSMEIKDDKLSYDVQDNVYGTMFLSYLNGELNQPRTTERSDVVLPVFGLAQDLTAKYKAKYPDAGVTKVSCITFVQIILYL